MILRSAQEESLPFQVSSIHLSVLLSLEHPLRGLLWFVDQLVLAPVHRVQRRPLGEVRPLQGDLASMASMASVPRAEVELTDSGQTLTGQGRVQHGVTCHVSRVTRLVTVTCCHAAHDGGVTSLCPRCGDLNRWRVHC